MPGLERPAKALLGLGQATTMACEGPWYWRKIAFSRLRLLYGGPRGPEDKSGRHVTAINLLEKIHKKGKIPTCRRALDQERCAAMLLLPSENLFGLEGVARHANGQPVVSIWEKIGQGEVQEPGAQGRAASSRCVHPGVHGYSQEAKLGAPKGSSCEAFDRRGSDGVYSW